MAWVVIAIIAALLGCAFPADARLGGDSVAASVKRHEVEDSQVPEICRGYIGDPKGDAEEDEDDFEATYEMVTVYEEAWYEKETLCRFKRPENMESMRQMGLERDSDDWFDKVPVVSIGSSSTQAYTCKEKGVGYFTGWQPETRSNANAIPGLASWIKEDSSEDEKTLLLSSGAGNNIPPGKLNAETQTAKVVPAEDNDALKVAELKEIAEDAKEAWEETSNSEEDKKKKAESVMIAKKSMAAVVEAYQKALKDYPGTVLLASKVKGVGHPIVNGWDVALLESSIIKGDNPAKPLYTNIVDWGGSGPKVKSYSPDSIQAYGNTFVAPDGKLDCQRLECALRQVLKLLKETSGAGPHFIAQTGLGREFWMKGKSSEDEEEGKCSFVIKKFKYGNNKVAELKNEIKLRPVQDERGAVVKLRPFIVPNVPAAMAWILAGANRTRASAVEFDF